jgi:glycosyltransferase involved in cell wall biosynthesis
MADPGAAPAATGAVPRRTPVSGCVITFQEADRIAACVQSLAFCDEVVVVDSGSTDGTCAIAAGLGARVVHNAPFPGFAAQRQFAVEQCRNDFVLCLDADERVTPELAAEIGALAAAAALEGGYELPRHNRYLGRRMRFGLFAPDRKLRLFDRRLGCVVSTRPPHDHVQLQPGTPVRVLRGGLDHLNYRDLRSHLRTIDSYARQFAQHEAARGVRVPLLAVPARALAVLGKSLVLKLGFLDGWRGVFCACLAAYSTWLKYFRAWRAVRRRAEAA